MSQCNQRRNTKFAIQSRKVDPAQLSSKEPSACQLVPVLHEFENKGRILWHHIFFLNLTVKSGSHIESMWPLDCQHSKCELDDERTCELFTRRVNSGAVSELAVLNHLVFYCTINYVTQMSQTCYSRCLRLLFFFYSLCRTLCPALGFVFCFFFRESNCRFTVSLLKDSWLEPKRWMFSFWVWWKDFKLFQAIRTTSKPNSAVISIKDTEHFFYHFARGGNIKFLAWPSSL